MKKITIIILCMIICTASVSCMEQEENESDDSSYNTTVLNSNDIVALELGGSSDDGDTGVHSSDYSLWSDESMARYQREGAAETYTITFDGTEYTGTYSYTALRNYTSYEYDTYLTDSGSFSIRTDNGVLVEFVGSCDESSYDTAPYSSIEDCQTQAENLASQYFDMSEYTLETSAGDIYNSFRYTIYSDGVPTRDTVNICVSIYTGEVIIYSAGDLGAFTFSTASTSSLTDSVSALTSENAASALEAKLDAIYGEYESYEVTNQVLAKLANGSVGLVSTVNVEFGEGDSYQVTILLCDSSSVTE